MWFWTGLPNFLSLLLVSLPSKLAWKVEIWYVDLVGIPNEGLKVSTFQASSHPLTTPRKLFFARFSSCLSLFLAYLRSSYKLGGD